MRYHNEKIENQYKKYNHYNIDTFIRDNHVFS